MSITILEDLKSDKNNHSKVDGIGSCRGSFPPPVLNELLKDEEWQWIWENNSSMEEFLTLNPQLDERYRSKYSLLQVLSTPLINKITPVVIVS